MIKNFKPRLYQETILATASLKNTLVVLPTGLGKTNIFLMLAAQRLKQYPKSKILLVGPTKPLIDQYFLAFENYFEIEKEEMAIFTGATAPEERKELYKVKVTVFWGGPVETEKIFILHSNEYQSDTTNNYGSLSVSQDHNILFDIAKNKGPEKSLVILGYSGWGSGQLEGEMERDHWILSDLDSDIIFEKESIKKWPKAYENSFIRL